MHIFFIPSWYPSPNSPLTGIFFRDQADAITQQYSQHTVSTSTWGQNDEQLLLWAKQPFQSLHKWAGKPKSFVTQIRTNWIESFSPAYTWTRRVWQGNMPRIIEANEKNLAQCSALAGKVDVIHAHVGFPAGHIARILGKKYGIPYLITEQMSPFPFPYFLAGKDLMPDLKLAYQEARANLAISPSLLAQMESFGVPRLEYVPNLIDESFFLPAPPKHEQFTFFMLGRMVEQKGVPYLLEAIAKLVQKYPTLHWRLGGEGESKLAYQQLAEKLGISTYITWLGELGRQDALQEFQDCHAFVLPSLHETMGVVLAEALACGKPLVGTYCGGAESVVTPANGLLARVADAQDLADKMEQMFINYARYLPEILRQDALARFSRLVIVDKLLRIYQKIIS